MTEMTDSFAALPPAVRRFVLHWGEMGQAWGVNRSIGQVHALLYLSERPMTAEAIADTLAIARSNVSTSIRELQGWGLVRRVHVMGDRRDHFEAEADVWELVRRIAEGRKAREFDPAVEMLATCKREADGDAALSPVVRRRIDEMVEFTSLVDRWAQDMRAVPRAHLSALMRLGGAIVKLLPGRNRRPTD
ncbi:MAG: MarR family transcriptional regulator [Hyphomicrobiales bacterium]|nr:MarR family transcriptional regulator [Hyphomicrobiales bacterium]